MFCIGWLCCVGCGFDLWPSNVSFPAALGGGLYNYTVRESPFKRDIVREFVDAARAAGIRPGIYYIVNNNILLERVFNATAAEKEEVILGQLREIWSSYGELVELWFDGGTQDPILGEFPPFNFHHYTFIIRPVPTFFFAAVRLTVLSVLSRLQDRKFPRCYRSCSQRQFVSKVQQKRREYDGLEASLVMPSFRIGAFCPPTRTIGS